MHRRTKLFAAALLFGSLAATLAYRYLQDAKQPTPRISEAVAATSRIEAGEVVTPEMLCIRKFSSVTIPADAVTDESSAVGKVVTRAVDPGKPIRLEQLANKAVTLGLSYGIPKGMRAVTIAIDPVVGVAGFIKPGDHVDIIATMATSDSTVTKTTLQDVVLLAVGPEFEQNSIGNAKPHTETTATLVLWPHEAETLALAEAKGKVRLSLRGTGDQSRVASKGAISREAKESIPIPTQTTQPPMKKGSETQTKTKREPEKQQAPRARTITIVRGTTVTEEPIR